MVICFNASPDAKRALDALLSTGQFEGISDAVSTALINYQIIQTAVGSSGQMILEPQTSQGIQPMPKAAITPSLASGLAVTKPTARIPELFALRETDASQIHLLGVPEVSPATNLPPAEWLFGQLNKLLPAKATCRALLNLLRDNPEGISINDAVAQISLAACNLGDYLASLDLARELRREDALAAAFPSTRVSDNDSRVRFGNQFVGMMKQGELTGLPAALRLIACTDAKECRISLTKVGADFALLRNPLLDGDPAAAKFTQEEISLLIGHAIRHVPEETSAYAAIVAAIESGADNPDKMDAYLRKRFKLPNERDIKQTFLTTQRTGALSRMSDLGMIGREKTGLRVKYVLTKVAQTFQKDLNNQQS